MKFWVDVLTPKQVLFFQPLVEELRAKGHEVHVTSREYREVKGLAEITGFKISYIGRHGGGSLNEKLLASSERVIELVKVVSEFSPDAAISFSSPECARVSFGLKIPHVCVNDSPHSEKVARLTIPLSDILLTPWIIPHRAWTRYGIARNRIVKYRSIDPVAWIKRWRKEELDEDKFGLEPALNPQRRTVVFRLVESQASYSSGLDEEDALEVLNHLSLLPDLNVVILCRYSRQLEEFRDRFSSKFIVPSKVIAGQSLLAKTDLFIGMGGTMSWEAALTGIPTISMRGGPRLYIEDYMVKRGLVVRANSGKDAIRAFYRLLDKVEKKKWEVKSKSVLAGMEDPIPVIISAAEKISSQ